MEMTQRVRRKRDTTWHMVRRKKNRHSKQHSSRLNICRFSTGQCTL